MNLSDHPYFPYPQDALTRFGFVVGDLITLGVLLLIFIPVLMVFFR